jgi:outer membrane murein-binding lipoprotein Lpp
MRLFAAVVIVSITLTLAGCKSNEQKYADLTTEYQIANTQYQKDCSVITSDADAKAITGGAFGNVPSPQQQSGIDQRQHEAEARKNSAHCKDLEAKRDNVTKRMLATQNR